MRPLALLAALAASAAFAPGAQAAVLLFEIFGAPGSANSQTFSFALDTARAPSFRTPDTIRFAPTAIRFTLPGDTTVITDSTANVGPSFFTAINQGGVSLLRLSRGDPQPRFFGPALFSGPTTAPTFLTGTFGLSSQPRNVPGDVQNLDFLIRITDASVSAVPEPSSWATMLIGFGLVGAALRRRPRVRVAFG